jgi:hypothetical protein
LRPYQSPNCAAGPQFEAIVRGEALAGVTFFSSRG